MDPSELPPAASPTAVTTTMDWGQRPADYVLFYAKVRTFLEDGSCLVKHTARRIFERSATARGLAIDKYTVDLTEEEGPPPPGAPDSSSVQAAPNNGGPLKRATSARSSGRRKPPYRSFYWAVRPSLRALLEEAEFLQMELPLKNWDGGPLTVPEELSANCCGSCHTDSQDAAATDEDKLLDKTHDFISAPFVYSKRHLFFGGPQDKDEDSEPTDFPLTGAQRIYLTHSILSRLDISRELRRALGPHPGTKLCIDCIYCTSLRQRIIEGSPIVLEHLLDAGIFADGFAMHDRTGPLRVGSCSSCLGCCPCVSSACRHRDETSVRPEATALELDVATTGSPADKKLPPTPPPLRADLRRRLRESWHCCCRVQPLHLVRLYFGEKLAFYYAWLGFVVSGMMSLTGIGLGFLVYGLINASQWYKVESTSIMAKLNSTNTTLTHGNTFSIFLTDLTQYIKLMFDNRLTIPYGCALTLWNLFTMEAWKSYEASLSHRWDVRNHEVAEKKKHGFTAKKKIHYPSCCRKRNECCRCFGVFTVIVFCVAIAIALAVAQQVSKLVASNRHCIDASSHAACIFLSIILPIAGHLVFIALFDWIYSRLAKCLTDWERHEFTTDFEFSYGLKAFAFRVANNYAALFYVAFVRQQEAKFGGYSDKCSVDNKMNLDCFNLLTIYVAGYIIGKALLKVLIDCISCCCGAGGASSCLKAPTRRLLNACCGQFKKAAYSAELEVIAGLEKQLAASSQVPDSVLHLMQERQLDKGRSSDQMLDDHLDKVILHGFVVLFGSACYITPVASVIAMALDLRLSSHQLQHHQRRPVPHPASGVGVWNSARGFLAHAGVFTTGGILAFSSDSLEVLGQEAALSSRLVLFVAFSGSMFLLKYLIASCTSAGSSKLRMRLKWEYFHVPKVLSSGTVPSNNAIESLEEMHFSDRWFHVLLPCFGDSGRSRDGAAFNPA